VDVDARLEALEAENLRLLDRIDMLERALGSDAGPLFPVEFGLTGSEAKVLNLLMLRDAVCKDGFMDAIYRGRGDDEPEVKIIDVFICKLRRKIRPFGVEIKTIWGRGYQMAPDDKARVRALCEPSALGDASVRDGEAA
jgi:two-component system cell cycle response regulator CtrA